jgi:type IV pilus assembly protein PilC
MNLRSQREMFGPLSLMIRSGTGLTHALDLLSDSPNREQSEAARDILRMLEAGHNLNVAFGKVFGPLTGGLMGIAEKTGSLVKTLENLSNRADRVVRQRDEMKAALVYPLGVLSVSLLVGAAICLVLLPQLLPFVMGMGVELPWPTVVLNAVYEWRWVWGNLLLLPVSVFLFLARTREDLRNGIVNWVKEDSPLLGPVLRQMALAHACEDLAVAVSSGLGLHEGLDLVAKTSSFPRLAGSLRDLSRSIKRGESVKDYFEAGHDLGPLVGGSLAVAEEIGRLPELLKCAGRLLEGEAEYGARRMIDLLEPAVMCLVSVVVGFLALAGLLPIYQVISAPL